jgi:2-methylcitrate dehydratase PrpD
MNVLASATLNENTEASRLAKFALELNMEDIPSDVLTLAKEHFLDAFGIALASTGFDFGRAILSGASNLGEGTGTTAIGSGVKLPAASAALVNGVLAHGLDFDDTHIGAIYHASAPALAAVLAAGEANNASGKAVLLAFVGALEIGCRLATAGAGEFHDRAFHPTSLCGTFAAAAAAGRLSGLDHQRLIWALGLCGSLSAGILERGSSWLKRLHPGWAAHSGLAAVAMAKAGFTGPDTVFEGSRGFYLSHIERIPAGSALPSHALGETWQSRGIALKPYPCCHFIHAFVDAALELRASVSSGEIERIECPLTPRLHKMVAEPRSRCVHPANPYEALFSVQYVVALALVRGRVDLAAFHDDRLDAPEVIAIAEKTFCVDDRDSDYPMHFPGEVIVHLRGGRILRCRKSSSLGTPDFPLSRAAIHEKFIKNATRTIPKAKADRIEEFVMGLERQTSIGDLLQLSSPAVV